MRIISGLYGGRVIKSPSDSKTRPTSDRLRESLFSILVPRIEAQTRFLDLCAGTGAVGIEALSRGCGFVSFVDKSKKACSLIEENLDLLEVPEPHTVVVGESAEKFLSRDTDKNWDIVFFDPPYESEYLRVLRRISNLDEPYLGAEGVLVVEHHAKNILPDLMGGIRRWRVVKQGESHLSFYERG